MMKVFTSFPISIFISFLVVFVSSEYITYEQLVTYRKLLDDGILDKMAEFYKEDKSFDETQCAKDISEWQSSILSLWALNMLDANGKFPSGVLRGNIYTLGQFDQCLAINNNATNPPIRGKYCTLNVAVPNITIAIGELVISNLLPDLPIANMSMVINQFGWMEFIWGVCIPHSCGTKELMMVMNSLSESLNITGNLIRGDESGCSIDEAYEWTDLEISALVVFGMIALIMVCSTFYDIMVQIYKKEKMSGHDILTAFSMYTNTKKITTINKSSNSLRCMHGIRAISTLWIVLGHRYSNSIGMPLQNFIDVQEWKDTYPAMIIVGASVVVDTFFLMSGLLLAYIFFSQYEEKIPNFALFYLHRFLRLWPAMAAFVYFAITIYKHTVHGPIWMPIFEGSTAACHNNWWSTLLYVQNYVHPLESCMTHLWYLAIDTQLYVLSPILLIPLLKNRKFGTINMIFWLCLSQISIITIVYMHKWGGVLSGSESYYIQYYAATHVRASVWMIGFVTGYIIYRTKHAEIKINIVVLVVVWAIALAILSSVVFGVVSMIENDHVPNHLQDSTFNAFARTGWALALSWMIFACIRGYGGPINWFLSLRFWEILGRISYSMYLLHGMTQFAQVCSMRVVPYFNHIDIIYLYFGDVVVTIFISYFWAMAFEYPFMAIEKALFHKKKVIAKPPVINTKVGDLIDTGLEIQISNPDTSSKEL